jgi:hypothetical protein
VGPLDLGLMLLLGLTSSLHCATMCGPLIVVASAPVALGAREASLGRLARWQIAYHLGRGMTYSLVGATLALAGAALGALSATRWLGAVLQLGVGIALMVAGIWQLWPRRARGAGAAGTPGLLRRLLTTRRAAGLFGLGLATGLLPCGVLYAAFARSLAAGTPLAGATLMLAFWLGTVPLLAALGLTSGRLYRAAGRYSAALACAALLATGGWLALRGYRALTLPSSSCPLHTAHRSPAHGP